MKQKEIEQSPTMKMRRLVVIHCHITVIFLRLKLAYIIVDEKLLSRFRTNTQVFTFFY